MFQARGCGVAIITPFKDDEIDFKSLTSLVNHVIIGGVDFIVVLGTTGESALLTTYETEKVLNHVLTVVDNRVPIVVGNLGGNNTQALVSRIKQMDLSAFDGIMSSSPSYVKPTQEGIYRHYMKMADVSPVPVIIYNVPGRTASTVEVDTIIRLADNHPRFMAVKEASGDMNYGLKLLKEKPDHLDVLSGDDPTTMSLCMMGASGGISVIANAFPFAFSEMIKAARSNNYALAKSLNEQMMDIHPYLYSEGNPTGIKSLLYQMGLCSKETRLPLVAASDQLDKDLFEQVQSSGILEVSPGVKEL
jgi:4-hydroxy-tetrahydrodipicolinate synthase